MSIVRNLFVLVLIACVGYSGYVIYLTHYAGANQTQLDSSLDEAPLFAPQSFTTLGSNKTSLEPTIVLSTSPAPEISLPSPADIAPPMATEPKMETPAAASGAISKTQAAESWESLPTVELLTEAEKNLADGKPFLAYRMLSTALQREDLSDDERTKLLATLEPLADKVVFAPHKHLALPPVTVKSGVTLEQIAKEHQLPLTFLCAINELGVGEQLEPGDALKVIDGPLTLRLKADRNELTLWTANGFARRFALDQLPAELQNGRSQLQRTANAEKTTLQVADVTIFDSTAAATAEPWNQIAALLAAETTLIVSGVRPVEAEAVAAEPPMTEAQVVSAEAPVPAEMAAPEEEFSLEATAPTDALRVEVFSPSKPIAVGNGATFGLRIINLSDKPAPDVAAIVFFSEGLEPIKIEGAEGKLAVGQAAFRPMTLAPRGHVDLEILATVNDYGRQIYRVEVRCDAWESHLVSEVAVSALNKAPEPPSLELTEKPQDPANPNPSKR
ncbi:hypothetical protein LOC68_08065 [Blastopirellula sp. JC732]|uniref:LysM domain-containing protein n=1 Tax=Blastopirellula sediminis TaxID=2894196 RepID=A0A9X1SFZ1_9BACT|nr:LysM peptidoglycan-binding domain-containing protein [Blastopirellula sediminis]MCC9608876.1 hypothetical protein [Blastopirellula sediminis]MCC9628347.1 hypothetical protein [Blastopirellula sediminis]